MGNRGFFPAALARDGRAQMTKLLKTLGYRIVALSDNDTKFGSVETWEDAKACEELFKRKRSNIEGIIVTLPNFGDERGVAHALKLAQLDVPVRT